MPRREQEPERDPRDGMSYPGMFYRPREDSENGSKNGKNGQPPPGSIIVEETQTTAMRSGQPIAMVCPFCKRQMETEVEYETGMGAWIASALICIAGCCCFAWIPLVTNILKDAVHHCSECKREVGRYIRLQPNPPPRRVRKSTKRRPAREASEKSNSSSWRSGSRSSGQPSPRKDSKQAGESSFFSWGEKGRSESQKSNGKREQSPRKDAGGGNSFFSWGESGNSEGQRSDGKRDLTERERRQRSQKKKDGGGGFSLW